MSELLTTSEAAEYLRLKPATIASYAKKGSFEGAFKIGADWRIPRAGIESFIHHRTGTGPRDPYALAPRSSRAQAARR